MTIKHALMALAAPVALLANPAQAAEYVFNLTGAYTASFKVDTDKLTPPSTVTNDYFEVDNIAGTFNGAPDTQPIAFNTAAFSGGLTFGSDFTSLWGAQLFSGTTALPTLLSGTFDLLVDGDPDQQATLTVSQAAGAVPEPATWGMMILGFGAIGFAMRDARRKVRVTFA